MRAYERFDAIRARIAHLDDGSARDVAYAVDVIINTPPDDAPRTREEQA